MKYKKSLGQNFLKSNNEVKKLLSPLDLSPEDFVIEIGPGDGSISNEILNSGAKLLAIEIDYDLLAKLLMRFHTKENFYLEEGDFLEINLNELLAKYDAPKEIKIVSNLPFRFYKEILKKIFNYNSSQTEYKITKMSFILQDEVAKDYVPRPLDNSLRSLTAQVYCNVIKKLETIPNHKFTPKPKIDAAIIYFEPKDFVEDKKDLLKFIKIGFSSPKKTLRNNLSSIQEIDKGKLVEVFNILNLGEKARPADLSLEQWEKLFNSLS
jgi:16S rRNA (adenine1518-N6/adenine1519-N6)-dimethyltransferase